MTSPLLLRPDWPVPANVVAVATTRAGGVSSGPYASLNLGDHVGDDPVAVAENRCRLQRACPGLESIGWLQQVHGIDVVPAVRAAADGGRIACADAQFSSEPGVGCVVMTADCLPVLFCDRKGTRVAAAHAGWRGLCHGVLEATVATFDDPTEVMAWLGPAIGPARFEVGPEVRAAFAERAGEQAEATAACFVPGEREHHWLADLYALARLRLRAAGVSAIHGGDLCTFTDAGRFYSYRREPVTGRMAALIYLMP